MPTIPKRIQIELKNADLNRPILALWSSADATDPFSVYGGPIGASAYLHIPNAHAAREYAQMLRAAADSLLDFALSVEQPQNFAVEVPA